jgi:sulfide:quinone oxidoreductase
MAHIIVIGAGLGGIPSAFDLRKHLPTSHRVTLIGARPHFEFTPSNPWIAVGWRTPKETQVADASASRAQGRSMARQHRHPNRCGQSKLTLDDGKE